MKKEKPKKVYVLMVSRIFPAYHPRKGEETNFPQYIVENKKETTVRPNYERWRVKADAINRGEAVLSIRIWTGKPYCSPQQEITELSKIEVQKVHIYQIPIVFITDNWEMAPVYSPKLNHTHIFIENSTLALRHPFKFAYRDGLSLVDFNAWFKKPAEDMALIHFGNFKY